MKHKNDLEGAYNASELLLEALIHHLFNSVIFPHMLFVPSDWVAVKIQLTVDLITTKCLINVVILP